VGWAARVLDRCGRRSEDFHAVAVSNDDHAGAHAPAVGPRGASRRRRSGRAAGCPRRTHAEAYGARGFTGAWASQSAPTRRAARLDARPWSAPTRKRIQHGRRWDSGRGLDGWPSAVRSWRGVSRKPRDVLQRARGRSDGCRGNLRKRRRPLTAATRRPHPRTFSYARALCPRRDFVGASAASTAARQGPGSAAVASSASASGSASASRAATRR
jgi:hypothetical protein